MMQSATACLPFPARGALPLEVDFLGGRLTSDGGLAWLVEADAALDLTPTLAAVVPDWRTRRGRHALPTLVAQRVSQIACGDEDQNDADHLRRDPLLKHVCGRLPQTGGDLASQPTFSRLENAGDACTCYRLAHAIGAVYLRERARDGIPSHMVLDLDGTDDPTAVYDRYVDRGASENWIKDLKAGCFADRLSCHRFWANQFRLLLHAAAYWLLDTLRRWLTSVGVARMTLATVRLRLIKIGGWVRERSDRVQVRLASSHPSEAWWRALATRPTPL